MRTTLCVLSCISALWVPPRSLAGQETSHPRRLTLAEARDLARRTNPELATARLNAMNARS